MAQAFRNNGLEIRCLGGPLDGSVVEVHDIPELGVSTMEFIHTEVNDKTTHIYRCMMHPQQYGIRAYVYEGTRVA